MGQHSLMLTLGKLRFYSVCVCVQIYTTYFVNVWNCCPPKPGWTFPLIPCRSFYNSVITSFIFHLLHPSIHASLHSPAHSTIRLLFRQLSEPSSDPVDEVMAQIQYVSSAPYTISVEFPRFYMFL